MTGCKYIEGRLVPISFQKEECFQNTNSDYFFLCLITEGYAVLMIDGEQFMLVKNMILCLKPACSITLLASNDLHAYSVSFAPSFINVNLKSFNFIQSPEYPQSCRDFGYPDFSLFMNHGSIYRGIMPLNADLAFYVKNSLEKIMYQLSDQPNHKWSCYSRSYILELMELLEIEQKRFERTICYNDDLILDVISFINQNLDATITLESLCLNFNVTRNVLNHRFKLATGKTVIDYVIHRRIELAKTLLAFTDLSVEEIAQSKGFYDQSYFVKTFKRIVGTTPLQYRRNRLEERLSITREE